MFALGGFKRGEEAPASANSEYIVDLSTLGKVLMAWHSQRPNISYSETKIIDKYFDNLFKKDYAPANVHALMAMWSSVYSRWDKKSGNPLGLNESLPAMRSYAPYHHLYAISAFMAILNKMPDGKETAEEMNAALAMEPADFSERYTAD